jgi:hypothetical protein
MSLDGDNTKHEVSTEDLLNQIITKLDIMIRHFEELDDQIFTDEDLNNPNTGRGMKVDMNDSAHVYATTESQFTTASLHDDAYNINTGLITGLTGTAGHSILYFKNDEAPKSGESRIIVDAFAFWTGTRTATITDDPVWTILRNPDGGDIISDATAVSINSNSDFGGNSSLASTSLAYKGKNGGTITATDGDHAIVAGTGRIYAGVPIVLHRGSSVGVSVDINTSGACQAYAALIFRRVDGNTDV